MAETKESIQSDFYLNKMKNTEVDDRKYFDFYKLSNLSSGVAHKGIPVMFITTPKLNITGKNIKRDPFFDYLYQTDEELLKMLNYGGNSISEDKEEGFILGTGSPFIKILSNKFSDFSVKSTTTTAKEIAETFYGYKQYLPGPNINSLTADTTSITYGDNSNLDVLKLHKVWVDYIEHISRGTMRTSQHAIKNRYIDFTSSIYLFVLEMDGETIQYYQKLTGCTPFNVPYEAFSSKVSNNQDMIEYSIEYGYSYKEDMNPRILTDFNSVSLEGYKVATFDEFEPTIYGSTRSLTSEFKGDYYTEAVLNRMSNPFVVLEGYANTDKKKYKLKFNDSNILNSNNSNDFNAGSSNGSGSNSGGGAF